MNKLLILLLSVISLNTAFAENTQPLDQLYPGYQATVLESPSVVSQLFSEMPLVFKNGGFLSFASQCYQRAEVWAYDLYHNKQINSMKVFVFYTNAFKQAHKAQTGEKFIWWFHVAPYVLNKDENGNLAESVLDPTFSKKPLSVYDWSQLFVDTHKACKEFVKYQDFQKELINGAEGTEHCYLVRVPATDYDPTTVEDRDSGKLTSYEWNMGQVNYAVKHAVNGRDRKMISQRLGLE